MYDSIYLFIYVLIWSHARMKAKNQPSGITDISKIVPLKLVFYDHFRT